MAQKKEWYTVYEQIKKSVVMIQVMGTYYAPNKEGIPIPQQYPVQQGSGFLYTAKDKTLGLITAYHVVRHRQEEHITVWALTRQNKWIKVDNCTISSSSSEKQDIAILNFAPPGRSVGDFETVGFPAHAFKGKILKTGVDIAWCGYPVTIKPWVAILQKGTIAGYDGSQYIIDGMPNPGSSGGPAFWHYTNEIVGMISAYTPEPSRYKLAILDQQNRLAQVFASPSGLGIAIPAMSILEIFGIK